MSSGEILVNAFLVSAEKRTVCVVVVPMQAHVSGYYDTADTVFSVCLQCLMAALLSCIDISYCLIL